MKTLKGFRYLCTGFLLSINVFLFVLPEISSCIMGKNIEILLTLKHVSFRSKTIKEKCIEVTDRFTVFLSFSITSFL